MSKFFCSADSNQEIINHYEELGKLVLNKSKAPISGNLGYSILLFRGMAAWIKTCLSSELIYSSRSTSSRLENTADNVENQPVLLPHAIQEEATTLLTNIILSHHLQQETRNCYA
jgi:hypothetical protein